MILVKTTDEFDRWFFHLRDKLAVAHIRARIDRLATGNFGDCSAVGKGVSQLRIHSGPGYRLYFTMHGATMVVLLAGGDKSTQIQDIKIAQQLAKSLTGNSP